MGVALLDEVSNGEVWVPDIEEGIPLPKNAADAFPELSHNEEVQMRAATIKLLADLKGVTLDPSVDDISTAEHLAHDMITNPKLRPEYAKYPNEVIAYLAGMVSQYNCALVNDLAEYKNYILSKLVHIVEHAADQKVMLTALRNLGEVDGVDLFKRRSETTILIKPLEEVEKELHGILESLDHKVLSESTSVIPT
jgi:hypothetical protein